MKKTAENYYQKKEFAHPSEGVTMIMTIDHIDGEDLDTVISLDGGFIVAGFDRKQFAKELGELIDKYRI